MKTAIFGGSFDPPHLAHVMACAYALSCTDAGRVMMIPCARHAFDKPLTPFEHRLAMCRLAVEGVLSRVEVSDIEGARAGVSYMVDTLDELARFYPRDSFLLMVGSDILDEVHKWKDYSRLQQLAPLLIIPRLGEATLSEAVGSRRFILPDINSTDIRERLAQGHMPYELLPRRVAEYIIQHRLYGWR
ncbi:MAG: nicotinate (nicotinamide) nucleotide adenylyltransferase [Candidatus Sumerlaeota bacterium]|nr:nicotinate (nicotinamide) nucleotide adenylyltransferase [Candidatus Sumerlaeota bacterium]